MYCIFYFILEDLKDLEIYTVFIPGGGGMVHFNHEEMSKKANVPPCPPTIMSLLRCVPLCSLNLYTIYVHLHSDTGISNKSKKKMHGPVNGFLETLIIYLSTCNVYSDFIYFMKYEYYLFKMIIIIMITYIMFNIKNRNVHYFLLRRLVTPPSFVLSISDYTKLY